MESDKGHQTNSQKIRDSPILSEKTLLASENAQNCQNKDSINSLPNNQYEQEENNKNKRKSSDNQKKINENQKEKKEEKKSFSNEIISQKPLSPSSPQNCQTNSMNNANCQNNQDGQSGQFGQSGQSGQDGQGDLGREDLIQRLEICCSILSGLNRIILEGNYQNYTIHFSLIISITREILRIEQYIFENLNPDDDLISTDEDSS